MAKVVSFSNQKGGVGKTTSCVNISAQIANKGKKVLMIDMDPQGNATSGLGISKSKIKNTIYDVIIGKIDVKDAIIKSSFKNLWVVPATIDLAGAELELYDLEDSKQNFTAMALDSVKVGGIQEGRGYRSEVGNAQNEGTVCRNGKLKQEFLLEQFLLRRSVRPSGLVIKNVEGLLVAGS